MKSIVIKLSTLIIVGLFLSGCATTVGTTQLMDQSVLDSLVIGKTTKSEVSAKLGRPLTTSSNGKEGTSQWTYSYSKSALSATAFIPGAQLLTGQHGESQEYINLIVTFDKNGVLIDKNISSSQVGG